MLRTTLAILSVASVGLFAAGCASNDGGGATASSESATQLAAYSAKAEYPQTQPSSNSEMHVAAIVNQSDKTIKLYNFGDKPILASNVWIDHVFVYHVAGIAPRSYVVVKNSEFYNNDGQNLAATGQGVANVVLETGNNVYSVEGPAMQ